jgi:hypothetical protein
MKVTGEVNGNETKWLAAAVEKSASRRAADWASQREESVWGLGRRRLPETKNERVKTTVKQPG